MEISEYYLEGWSVCVPKVAIKSGIACGACHWALGTGRIVLRK